jgi:hypothetical protein
VFFIVCLDADKLVKVLCILLILMTGENALNIKLFLYDIDLPDKLTAWKVPLSLSGRIRSGC